MAESEENSADTSCMDWPSYIGLDESQRKEEARRCFILTMLCDDNGVLLREWRKEVQDLEIFLREGTAAERSKRVSLERVK